jgi:hypothetical protein
VRAGKVESPREPSVAQALADMPAALIPYKPLFQATTAIALLDVGDKITLDLRLTYAKAERAEEGELALRTARYVARETVPHWVEEGLLGGIRYGPARRIHTLLSERFQSALKAAAIERRKTVVHASAELKVEPARLAALTTLLRQAREYLKGSNNLRQLALAMHLYADTMRGQMPANAIYGKDGKALLSWRVAILLDIGQAPLYAQFKLDEPWDSPHNKKLLAKMPKIYAPVRGKTKVPHATFYQVFTGPSTPFQGKVGPRMPVTFLDGTSNTILIVEGGEAVPWTKPEDLPYDDKKPLPKLGGQFPDGFFAAFADGAVRFLRKDADEQTLRWLINPADGNFPNLDRVLPKRASAR